MQAFLKIKPQTILMWTIKIISLLLILSITLVAGFYPFFKKLKTKQSHAFPIGESLAAGVFWLYASLRGLSKKQLRRERI